MSEDQDALPAFPQKEPLASDCHGMTLRDYFAAAALQGLLAKHSQMYEGDLVPAPNEGAEFAYAAYEFAEQMLKVRAL